MSEFINAFNSSWSWVQVVILLSSIALPLTPLYFLLRYSQSRWRMPPDTLFAVRRQGDILTIDIHKNAGMGAHQLNNLLEISGLLELNPPDAPKEETEQKEENPQEPYTV